MNPAQYFALLLSLTFHDPINYFLGVARLKNYINGQLMSDDYRAAVFEYFSIYFLQAKSALTKNGITRLLLHALS